MGRKAPRRRSRLPGQSQMGTGTARDLGTLRGGGVVADGTDEEEAWARRTDDWIVWEAEEEAARRPRPRN
jgi:hypothetical protein